MPTDLLLSKLRGYRTGGWKLGHVQRDQGNLCEN